MKFIIFKIKKVRYVLELSVIAHTWHVDKIIIEWRQSGKLYVIEISWFHAAIVSKYTNNS